MKIIKDKELILTKELNLTKDTDKKIDLLNTYNYVSLVKDIINDHDNDISRIALYGKWGTGKSTILKTVKYEFKDNKEIKFIDFDAWKYAKTFRRSFLMEVSNKLKDNCYNIRNLFLFSKFNPLKMILYPIILLFLILVLYNINNSETKSIVNIYPNNFIAYFTVLVVFLTFFFNKLWDLHLKTLNTPESFKELFNKLTKNYFNNEFCKKNFLFIKNECKKKKLVIIIDNIDRCSKEDALNILFDIKTIIDIDKDESNKNIIILIPIDKSAILDALRTKVEKENYLKKLFDFEIYIKEYSNQSIYQYTLELLEDEFKNNDNFIINGKNIVLDKVDNIAFLLSQKYSRDPRKIIKFLNILKGEIFIYKLKEKEINPKNNKTYIPKGSVTDHIDFLVKVLIIREQWSEYYKEMVLKPYFLLTGYSIDNQTTKIIEDDDGNQTREMSIQENNDEKIYELVNLKKHVNSNKPHYFLGWEDGALTFFDNLLDKKDSWDELRNNLLLNQENNIFLTAFSYKFIEKESNISKLLYFIIKILADDKIKIDLQELSYLQKEYWYNSTYKDFYEDENKEIELIKASKKIYLHSKDLINYLLSRIETNKLNNIGRVIRYVILIFDIYQNDEDFLLDKRIKGIFDEQFLKMNEGEEHFIGELYNGLIKYPIFKDNYLNLLEDKFGYSPWINLSKTFKEIIFIYD